MARVKHIVGWISVVLLVVTPASIWMLTEQNVEQTSSLSESTARAVEGQAADVRPDAAQGSQAGDAAGDADSTTGAIHPDPLAPVRLWMGANIRRVAHTVSSSLLDCLPRRQWHAWASACHARDSGTYSLCSFAPSALSVTKCTRSLFLAVIST